MFAWVLVLVLLGCLCECRYLWSLSLAMPYTPPTLSLCVTHLPVAHRMRVALVGILVRRGCRCAQ